MSDSKTTDGVEINCLQCKSAVIFDLRSSSCPCPSCGAEISRCCAIEEFLKSVMAETFQFKRDDILSSSLLREIGDSLGTIEMLMKLESEFGISIGHQDIEELETVREVARYIETRVEAAP